jgi:hypothetical protein
MADQKITSYCDNEYVYVKMPIDTLVFAQKNKEDYPYIITDKKSMAKFVSENILEFCNDVGRSEVGETNFLVLLDDIFTEAYESAETWIESSDDDEE